jgi:hypothetical protein
MHQYAATQGPKRRATGQTGPLPVPILYPEKPIYLRISLVAPVPKGLGAVPAYLEIRPVK